MVAGGYAAGTSFRAPADRNARRSLTPPPAVKRLYIRSYGNNSAKYTYVQNGYRSPWPKDVGQRGARIATIPGRVLLAGENFGGDPDSGAYVGVAEWEGLDGLPRDLYPGGGACFVRADGSGFFAEPDKMNEFRADTDYGGDPRIHGSGSPEPLGRMTSHLHHITAAADRVPFGQKMIYGTGQISNVILAIAIANLAPLVLTVELGVSALLVGLAMGLPRVWDAFTDPVIGYLSDNARTRWGRRKPFMFVGLLCVAACLALYVADAARMERHGVFLVFSSLRDVAGFLSRLHGVCDALRGAGV